MSIETTDVVILKQTPFGETSRIITLLSRDFGLLRGVAKGVRQQSSRLARFLEPLTEVELVLYYYTDRDLHLISKSSELNPFHQLRSNPLRLAHSLVIVEHVLRLLPAEDPSPQIYELLVESLRLLDEGAVNERFVLLAFRVKLLHLLGIAPRLEGCITCGKKLTSRVNIFFPSQGGFICEECPPPWREGRMTERLGERALRVRREVVALLNQLSKGDIVSFGGKTPGGGLLSEAGRLLGFHTNYHLGVNIKSERFLEEAREVYGEK